jgi:predicted esterase
MITEEYAPGRLVDVHGDGHEGIVLMWHGRGPNERGVMTHLASAIATSGVRVLAADWDSTAHDHGRSDVLRSLGHAQRAAAELGIDAARLVVVGWSLGATAAISLAVQPDGPARTVLLAPGDGPRAVSAVTGAALPRVFPAADGGRTIDILHGARDDISHPALVRGLAARLRAAGWDTTLTEVDAEHAGIVGTVYDTESERCVAAQDPVVVAASDRVAATIIAAATASS